MQQETIAAVATPAGSGGIGIVRISGALSLSILQQIFVSGSPRQKTPPAGKPTFPSHVLRYGHIKDPVSNEVLDEVMAVFMQAPKSYTCEDVVEIHCHAGHAAMQRILFLVLSRGARPAEAGEFTRRAFMHGRIDLSQAEAVIDLINAKTSGSQRIAIAGIKGLVNRKVQTLRDPLVRIKGMVEVAIDFPDEDAEILDKQELASTLQNDVITPLTHLIDEAGKGIILRDGAQVVLFGRPNVGKSSLMNTLLRQERALVTHIPGTTRDTIEEWMDFGGIACRLVDMAGVRDTDEPVEKMGVERARQKCDQADLILFMVDGACGVTDEDIALAQEVQSRKTLLVVNKIDQADQEQIEAIHRFFSSIQYVDISAKTGSHLVDLEQKIAALLTTLHGLDEVNGVCPNMRQKEALQRALTAARTTSSAMARDLPPVFYAVDLQECIDALGEVTGEITTDDVLDGIFSRFCIGK